MEIKGKVHEVGKLQEVSETFKKRDLIVEYAENPTYPEYIRFEALQDKTSLLDGLKSGDEVELAFNLRGRPWTNKLGQTNYFNSLVVWKINKLSEGSGTSQNVTPSSAPNEDDDLPF